MTTDILTAENAVLGACLSDCALWGTVLNALHETDLAGDANRCIFRAARTLDADGKTPDAPAIANLVQQDGIERRYLFELMGGCRQRFKTRPERFFYQAGGATAHPVATG